MPGPPPPGPHPPGYADRPWLASYPPGVPADVDFPRVPLTRLLDDAAAAFPTTTAIAFLGSRLSYRALRDSVDAFAAALAGLGVHKGDRVAVVLPNCPQNVITFYAALRLGAVVVEHNALSTEAELAAQLVDCAAKVVVCLDRAYERVAAGRPRTALEHVVVASVADYLPAAQRLTLGLPLPAARQRRRELTGPVPRDAPVHRFRALLRSGKAAGRGSGRGSERGPGRGPARQAPIDPQTDLAALQYTGGTTGVSKGAMLTHANLVANAYQNRLWLPDVTPGREVVLTVLPLFHAYGLTVCMNTGILLAATLVLLPRFDIDLVLAAVDEFRPTLFPGVPPIYQAIVDSPKIRQHDLSSIRVCISGAMRLPTGTQQRFERASGGRLVEGYGLTEASPSTHANPITGPGRPGTIGLPLPGTFCRVLDQEDPTREVPTGEPGELAIRGPQVFVGYWNKPEETARTLLPTGEVLTGDVAVMDPDGFFRIVDRKKELILTGGFSVYPTEVEEALRGHPAVADCAVVGVPDRYRGETVKAYVVRRPDAQLTAEEIREHCAATLTAYKVPRLVEFRDALPRGAGVGKMLRRVLVEEERRRRGGMMSP